MQIVTEDLRYSPAIQRKQTSHYVVFSNDVNVCFNMDYKGYKRNSLGRAELQNKKIF